MDLLDRVNQLASRIERQKDICTTEEAAKTSFVLPFLKALGYDVFDPFEVRPEFVADVGVKKGEKVDYAISINDQIQILVECKPIGSKLEIEHASQLFRYFSVTSARFAVLTDGIQYCFYTDLDAPNKMDSRPFFALDMLDLRSTDLNNLKKFTKEAFDVEAIISTAADMKYQRALKEELSKEFANPSGEFTKLIAGRVYNGRLTQSVAEKFADLLKKAVASHIRETIDERLKGALETKMIEEDEATDCDVETTQTEIEGLFVIKAIVSEVLDPARIYMRDSKSYCAILLDDNNRRPIARLHFHNEKRLRVQIFDESDPQRLPITRVSDLFRFKPSILKAVAQYIRSDLEKNGANAEIASDGVAGKSDEHDGGDLVRIAKGQ